MALTGLTLPGVIDDQGRIGGRLILPRPQRGPEENQRRSLQTFGIRTVARFREADIRTKAPAIWVASTRLRTRRRANPLTSVSFFRHQVGEAGRAVDVGTDGGGAHVDVHQLVGATLYRPNSAGEHDRAGAELLAKGHGFRILILGAAHLEHIPEFLNSNEPVNLKIAV